MNNITVTGLPLSNTLDISITGTTEYAVQVGNALGALTSLPFGSAGQVLISSGNLGDPTWQSIGTIEPITDHAIPIGTITGSITSLLEQIHFGREALLFRVQLQLELVLVSLRVT